MTLNQLEKQLNKAINFYDFIYEKQIATTDNLNKAKDKFWDIYQAIDQTDQSTITQGENQDLLHLYNKANNLLTMATIDYENHVNKYDY